MRILIPCFKPFRGRSRIGSQTLARYLQACLQQTPNQSHEVRVVDIPVRWGAVESVLNPVIESWQPDVLIGLGEGGPASIAIETTGRNIRQGDDVDSTPPPNEVIVDNGEPERTCRFSFTWTHQMPLSFPIKISIDAGTYLCNNALYYICGTGCGHTGFIHIPPQGDDDDTHYCALYGPILYEILRQNTSDAAAEANIA
ncbi:MAG: hypothetical protein E4H27_01925 [Anaerolineales bacterium]|nr:MAG: hypothetical protein E4H27_01925 [Anaerolineales bacterium]